MIGHAAIDCALGGLLLPERLSAGLAAGQLTRRLEFLTWAGRADILDAFFWSEAKTRLPHDMITSVINRRVGGVAALAELAAFTNYARAVLTAALIGRPLAAMLLPAPEAGPKGGAWSSGRSTVRRCETSGWTITAT